MINFDNYVNENKTKHNENWPYISDHLYRILIIGGSGSGKIDLLLNLIENQPDFDKRYYFRDYIEILSDANYDAKQNETEGKGLKILTPKQMFQRLSIALAQVKAGNNSESLLNEIRQIVYSLYQSKQITKKYIIT